MYHSVGVVHDLAFDWFKYMRCDHVVCATGVTMICFRWRSWLLTSINSCELSEVHFLLLLDLCAAGRFAGQRPLHTHRQWEVGLGEWRTGPVCWWLCVTCFHVHRWAMHSGLHSFSERFTLCFPAPSSYYKRTREMMIGCDGWDICEDFRVWADDAYIVGEMYTQ